MRLDPYNNPFLHSGPASVIEPNQIQAKHDNLTTILFIQNIIHNRIKTFERAGEK